jgi:hypothetical protein
MEGRRLRDAERRAARRRADRVDRRRRNRALADDVAELTAKVRAMVEDPALRDRLGAAARTRAREFTWDRTAAANLAVLERAATSERRSVRESLAGSETLKAGGMAAATLASNAIALLFTVLFARILGAEGLRLARRAGLHLPHHRGAGLGAAGGRPPARRRSALRQPPSSSRPPSRPGGGDCRRGANGDGRGALLR